MAKSKIPKKVKKAGKNIKANKKDYNLIAKGEQEKYSDLITNGKAKKYTHYYKKSKNKWIKIVVEKTKTLNKDGYIQTKRMASSPFEVSKGKKQDNSEIDIDNLSKKQLQVIVKKLA